MYREHTREVKIGDRVIGGGNPVLIQSMTNTRTEDVEATVAQILRLEEAGCDIIRSTVPNMEAAKAIREIKKRIHIPLVADIHFDNKMAIAAMENGADKIRINPGNIGGKENVAAVVSVAKERNIPIRVGVNSGSLERQLVEKYGGVTAEGIVESALDKVKMIEDLGYQVIPAEQFRRKQLRQAAAEIFAIALLFVILQRFGILNHLAPDSLAETGMGYGMLFVIGLITSVHCIAMCGGINLSQTLQKQEANAEEISRSMFRNTFSYNMGRVVSYTVIGGFLGAVGGLAGIGDSLQASTVFQGSLKLLAGIIMVVMGVNMLGIFPGLRKLRIHIPFPGGKSLWKKRTPFLVGLCNGFMPCGPLQSMEIVALASGSWVAGAFSMFCFSLGTVPLMLGFGSIFSALGKKFTRQILKTGAILVVVMGLAMMSQGSVLSGLESRSGEKVAAEADNVQNDDQTDVAVEKDGVQYVSSTLCSGWYPDITVKAGEPVKWEINVPEGSINGCNYRMILQDFGMDHTFENGENVIEFIPEKEGVYTYSCWMGMITGTIYVTGK